MVDITKEELLFDDYSWKAKEEHDDPKKRKSDGERFSRSEGYEMLYLLNHGFTNSDKLSIAQKQQIEWSIRSFLPSGTQSRSDVVTWVVKNYEVHSTAYTRAKAEKGL